MAQMTSAISICPRRDAVLQDLMQWVNSYIHAPDVSSGEHVYKGPLMGTISGNSKTKKVQYKIFRQTGPLFGPIDNVATDRPQPGRGTGRTEHFCWPGPLKHKTLSYW